MPVLTDTRVRVARDLRAITAMSKQMLAQAVADANSQLMPGGLAMVALATVANQEAFANLIDAAENRAIQLAAEYDLEPGKLMPTVEEDDWEPPLQTMCFWSEQWRAVHGMIRDARPTIVTETNYLRWAIDWAWENEPKWDAFVADVIKTRSRMEAILMQGERPTARGVPCMYDECKKARLIRKTVPAADKNGNKIWRLTDWHCPSCKRTWTEDEYQRNVYAAIHREKMYLAQAGDDLELYCTVELAAKRVGRPVSTVRVWLHREQVSEICVITHRSWRFVSMSDVEHRHQLALDRAEKVKATKAAKYPDLEEDVA